MKCSACCITQSSFAIARLFLIVCLVLVGPHLWAQSGAPPEMIRQWNDLAMKNALIAEGKLPFHLKLQFQIHDLNGKPADVGILEEWWAGDKGFRLEITSPLEHVVGPGKKDLTSDDARRENYLVMQLLHEVVAPMAHLRPEQPYNVFTEKRTLGKLQVTCYQANSPNVSVPNPKASYICVNPETQSIRQVPYGNEVTARNTIATFRDGIVAMDTEIAYSDVKAIEGHIITLQSFDPSQSAVTLVNPAAKRTVAEVQPPSEAASISAPQMKEEKASMELSVKEGSGSATAASENVFVDRSTAGERLVRSSQPIYPQAARRNKIQGSVLLYVTVSPEGKVQSSFPIASPSPLLTGAAEECVKDWAYKPWELNGSPVQMSTTLQLNFLLNGG